VTAKALAAIEDQQNQRDKLAELQAEVAALHEELRRAQRLAMVGTMTAMVVHEFNNILTTIINYARMAEKDPEMVDKAITGASTGGQRATEICQALLGIVDAQQNKPPTQQSIAEMTREILSAMARSPADAPEFTTTYVPPAMMVPLRSICVPGGGTVAL